MFSQGFVSFLLPCFAVDHLYLCSDEYLFSEEETPVADGNHSHLTTSDGGCFSSSSHLMCVCVFKEADLDGDVLQLVQCLRLVSECLQGELGCVMDRAVEMLMSPERAAEQVLDNLLTNDRSVTHTHTHSLLFSRSALNTLTPAAFTNIVCVCCVSVIM